LNHLGVLEKLREKGLGCDIDKIELFSLYSAARLGEISFLGEGCGGAGGIGEDKSRFKGLRVLRKDLCQAMLECVQAKANVTILWGKRTLSIAESDRGVALKFEDGESVEGSLLIGADGIHSVVRSLLVDPERRPEYTGIAGVCGFTDVAAALEEGQNPMPWDTTGLVQSQRGSLLCTFCSNERKEMMVAAIMETPDVHGKDGWRAKGAEQDKIKADVLDRYSGSKMKFLDLLIRDSRDWTLYPVYMLGPGGKWSSKRTILLGDAAHAMPPQGESSGIALNDAVLFARVLSATIGKELPEQFAAYEKLRRPDTDAAYKQATFGWNTQKDSSWFAFYLHSWLTVVFLWWTARSRQRRYAEDIATIDLKLG
jgi:salicylate hydroxylase